MSLIKFLDLKIGVITLIGLARVSTCRKNRMIETDMSYYRNMTCINFKPCKPALKLPGTFLEEDGVIGCFACLCIDMDILEKEVISKAG